jgi:TonB-linked SusC/RagA family outer membrane protein
MFFGAVTASAQSSAGTAVTGKITDADSHETVVGARISVRGKAINAMNNESGEYKLTVPEGNEVLIVSAPGYATREVAVRGRSQVDIQLFAESFSSGYESVVTLTGEQAQALLTHPEAQTIDFSNSSALTVESEIQARLGSSVRAITRSGVNGIGAAMFIRGINSLHANAQPLIVVDGVVWDNQLSSASIHEGFFSNSLSNIDVKDIESVTVLKDGNSLYGSKASNGVILINTVRGKGMVTRISASAVFGSNQKPQLPKMMNASQWRIYASDQVSGLKAYGATDAEIANMRFLSDDPTTSYYSTYHNNSNWADEVYQTGMTQMYSLSVNGGDDIALYSLSMGYALNEGLLKNTDMERLTARFNSDINMSSKLKTKVNIAMAKTDRNLYADGVNFVSAPGFISLIKEPILSSYKYNLADGKMSETLNYAEAIDPLQSLSNPVALIDPDICDNNTATHINFNISVRPEFQITKNIKASTLFSYGLHRVKESSFLPQSYTASQTDDDGRSIDNIIGDLTQRQNSLTSDTRLEWNLKLNPDNNLYLLGGFRYMYDNYEIDQLIGYNGGNNYKKVLKDILRTNSTITGDNIVWKSLSWYLDADYDYQKKYFLHLTAAADASSRFGSNTKDGISVFGATWGIFPSAEAAWLISSEKFMADAPAIDFLKLRVGYGLTGNDDINTYASQTYFVSRNYMGNAVGLQLSNIKNEAIQWETSAKANAGIDLHLFNERLGVSFDVFDSHTKNLLTLKQLKEITGLEYYWSNDGELKNTGYELSANAKLLNYKNFKWELGASVGHYKNEITALPDADGYFDTEILGGTVRTQIGQPVGVFYGYRTLGVFSTSAEATATGLKYQKSTGELIPYQAGDVHFVDNSNDDIINAQDQQIIGDPNPDVYGAITNRFSIKKFTVDALFTYSYGNDIYNYLRSQLESGSGLYNQTTAMLNRWTHEGQVTDVPRAVYGDPMNNNVFSDRWIEDGSYLRLKKLSVSYELPLNSEFIQGVTVWLSAENLWTWSKYLGSDPEFSMNNSALYQGIDAGLLPQSRSYYLGVKINL